MNIFEILLQIHLLDYVKYSLFYSVANLIRDQ